MNASHLSPDDLYPLIESRHCDPFRLLGVHREKEKWVARVWRPDMQAVKLVDARGKVTILERVHASGLFEGVLDVWEEGLGYHLELTDFEKNTVDYLDPYAFPPLLGELDIFLFCEGTHHEVYKKLGAHIRREAGVQGVHFAVWAPHAQRVSVVGDWNGWDGRIHPMRKHPSAGIWEIFLPEVREDAHYKFEVRSPYGEVFLKTDPFAFFAQHGTQTACMVYDLENYAWKDDAWMQMRKTRNSYAHPLSIYEVHLGSWKHVVEEKNRPFSYAELAEHLLPYVKEMGFTHIELMPVMEHPFDGSWGYQVINYYAPTSRFGTPDAFRAFVDRAHQLGLGVILDWVPGHFPKDAHGLARFDGTCLFEYADPRLGEHKDWGTLIFDYSRNEVRNFLIGNALFWMDCYHIDGLRVDAVASMLYLDYSRKEGEWVPNCFGGRENLDAIDFLKRCNEECYRRFPGTMMIAEESTSWPGVSHPTYAGGLGFGYKWNMGWMNDSLRYIARDPVHRKHHQGEITFSMLYAFHEHFILVLSHDEVVHGKGSLLAKMPGDDWQKFANVRLFLAWMWGHPGKKLVFQGMEFGQWREWSHAESLDWHLLSFAPHVGLQRLVQDLNAIYQNEPALFECDDSFEGFEWIDFEDAANSVWSFYRKSKSGEALLFVVNATPVVRMGYRLGVDQPGEYREVLNTDALHFGGSGAWAFAQRMSESVPWHGRNHSLVVDLPPLAVLILKMSLANPHA